MKRTSFAISLAIALAAAPAALFAQTPALAGHENRTTVYMVTLEGVSGLNVAVAPIKQVLADAEHAKPDVFVIKLDCTYAPGPPSEREADSTALDQVALARQLDQLLTDRIHESETWAVKPRLVFWIRRAEGGMGMLAFTSPEINCTSDARHAAPDVTGQDGKGRSLRLGRAQGLAIKGGHPVELFNAMVRRDYVLSVSVVDGKPEWHEFDDGETYLTGRDDLLVLDARMANRLGLSRGTADTSEQLFHALGLAEGTFGVISRGDVILSQWRRDRAEAEKAIVRLNDAAALKIREMQAAKSEGRAAARQAARRMLEEALELLAKYADALSPDVLGKRSEELARQIGIQLKEIDGADPRVTPRPPR